VLEVLKLDVVKLGVVKKLSLAEQALDCVLTQNGDTNLAKAYAGVSRHCRAIAAPLLEKNHGQVIANFQKVQSKRAILPVVPSFCSQRMAMEAGLRDVRLFDVQWYCPSLYAPSRLRLQELSPQNTAVLLAHLLAKEVGLGFDPSFYLTTADLPEGGYRLLFLESQRPVTEVSLPYKAVSATGKSDRQWINCLVKSLDSNFCSSLGISRSSESTVGVICYVKEVGSDYSEPDDQIEALETVAESIT